MPFGSLDDHLKSKEIPPQFSLSDAKKLENCWSEMIVLFREALKLYLGGFQAIFLT